MVYLFIGQDFIAKDIQLKKIKEEFLRKETEQFNFDTLYSKELTLKNLQEKLLTLPVGSPKRIVVLKANTELKPEIKDFLLGYTKKPPKEIVLVLDFQQRTKRDDFIERIGRVSKVLRFQEITRPDAFALSRSINLKRPDFALGILNQLLEDGLRPEMILGGLRYAWERDSVYPLERKRRLKLLLNCDIEIKTGKLKPVFALEKLVISLCGPVKPLH